MNEPWPPNGGTLMYRVTELERDVQTLTRKVDRLLWAILGLALSIAGSAAIFAFTVLALRGKT